jgi:hypothetical protein
MSGNSLALSRAAGFFRLAVGGRLLEHDAQRGEELNKNRHGDFVHRDGHGAPLLQMNANLARFAPTTNGTGAASLTGRETHISNGLMHRTAVVEGAKGAKSRLGAKFQVSYLLSAISLMQKGNRSVFSSPLRLAGDKNHVNPVAVCRRGTCAAAGTFLCAGSVDRARLAITLPWRS